MEKDIHLTDPGRVRGAWRPDIRYSEGDLVEFHVKVFYEPSGDSSKLQEEIKWQSHQTDWWLAQPEPYNTAVAMPYQFRRSSNLNRSPNISIKYQKMVSEGEGTNPITVPGEFSDAVAEEIIDSDTGKKVTAWKFNRELFEKGWVYYTPVRRGTNHWGESFWRNETEERTGFPNKYVRLQSVNPHLIDTFILSKGIPSWYYYDLLGHFNTRLEIRNIVDVLRTVRGTMYGMKTYLNLINLTAVIHRLKPEELYEIAPKWLDEIKQRINDYDRENGTLVTDNFYNLSNNEIFDEFRDRIISTETKQKFDGEGPDPYENKLADLTDKRGFVRGKIWNEENPVVNNDFEIDEFCYKNWYDEKGEYIGCSLYRCINAPTKEEREDESFESFFFPRPQRRGLFLDGRFAEPDSHWEWVYDVKNITYERGFYQDRVGNILQSNNPNPDNSLYQIELANLINDKKINNGGIIRERDQQRYTCYLKRLMEFLVPAWIRLESSLHLLDLRQVEMNHVHFENKIADLITEGPEPYTLTIKPYVGYDPDDENWNNKGEINHTAAWDTEILVDIRGAWKPIDKSVIEVFGVSQNFPSIARENASVYTYSKWSNTTQYQIGQKVIHEGVFYNSLRQVAPNQIGIHPKLLNGSLNIPAHNREQAYKVGDKVTTVSVSGASFALKVSWFYWRNIKEITTTDIGYIKREQNPDWSGITPKQGSIYWEEIEEEELKEMRSEVNVWEDLTKQIIGVPFMTDERFTVRLVREDYLRKGDNALIKVTAKNRQKLKLVPKKNKKIEESDLKFHRWQLLNWFHIVPHWTLSKLLGRIKHIMIKPYIHKDLKIYQHDSLLSSSGSGSDECEICNRPELCIHGRKAGH